MSRLPFALGRDDLDLNPRLCASGDEGHTLRADDGEQIVDVPGVNHRGRLARIVPTPPIEPALKVACATI